VRIEEFGRHPDGRPVHRLVLGSAPGPELHLLDLGATAHRLELTGRDGRRRNVLLGHADPQQYLDSSYYIGGTIGRYANRIAAGRFRLDGREVQVGTHDRGNHLHGGPDGFDRRLWAVVAQDDNAATLELVSPDGDQGFPGELRAQATYVVGPDQVSVTLTATTSATTVVNLTSHAYFNLDGEGAGTIDHHQLQVAADEYTPVDHTGIPCAGHAPVADTPFDLRKPTSIGRVVRSGHEQIAAARGIDHNYVVRGEGLRTDAVLLSHVSGIRLEIKSDQPGLQVYTGNFLDGGLTASDGSLLRQGDGIALEPQLFPDSPNQPGFPDATLRPGETYRAEIRWVFGEVTAAPR
jgi:galactose mutarotase-like enzyme